MNKKLTTVEKFNNHVNLMKKSIVSNIKLIKKLMNDLKKANGDSDRKALLEKIQTTRDTLERYRMTLDDLTVAFVREKPMLSKKIYEHFKYKTAEGFLMDRDSNDIPSLYQMVNLIANHTFDIPLFYRKETDEYGRPTIKRNISYLGGLSMPRAMDYDETKAIRDAVGSGIRHK